jgi:hypothetical protein
MLSAVHRLRRFLLAVPIAFTFACTNPIDAGLDFALEGTWEGIDGLTIEFEGDQAVIADFGDSPLGTNPSVLGVGDPFIDQIECGEESCTGRIVDPVIVNGVLEQIGHDAVTIEGDEAELSFSSPALSGTATFTPADGGPGTGGGGDVQMSASCSEWWDAVTEVGTWRIVDVQNPPDFQGAPPSEVTLTFSGENRFEFSDPAAMGYSVGTGEISFDEKIFGTDYCRFVMWTDEGHQIRVLFPRYLSGNELRLDLASEGDTRYWLLQAE